MKKEKIYYNIGESLSNILGGIQNDKDSEIYDICLKLFVNLKLYLRILFEKDISRKK